MTEKPSSNAFGQAAASSATLPQPASPPEAGDAPRRSSGVAHGSGGAGHSFGVHHEDRSRGYMHGQHSKPTKASLQDRQGSPSGAGYTTSGIDRAMQQLADREHKRTFKARK